MFCPECEGEFREGFEICPDCNVGLVEELQEPEHDVRPLVAVFETAHPDVLPLATSLLEETDIPYTVKGEETLGLFPGTGVGLVVDPSARAAQLLVPASRADEAKALMAGLEEAQEGGEEE